MTDGVSRSMTMAMLRPVIDAIHTSPTQCVVFLSGGASQVIGWLTSVPGASGTLIEAVVPYSRMSMIQLLGKIPDQFASQNTAQEMALLAYNRALKLSRPGSPALGVGFTGSLATTRPKLGEHRFHLSTRTSDSLWLSTVTLSKGLRTREEEETVSSQVLLKGEAAYIYAHLCGSLTRGIGGVYPFWLQALATACKVPADFDPDLSENDERVESQKHFSEDEELEQLLNGEICFKVYSFPGETQMLNKERKIILPGSFNPLHDGHLKLLEVASGICGDAYPCFEISAINADKPPLTIPQIKDRVKQFEKFGKTVIISNQPFFYKKAELFPGSAFVIGADTAVRLVNPKYYDGIYQKMIDTLLGCKNTGCLFLVGGRNVDGVFKVLEDLEIPEVLKGLFVSIPAEGFRMDISSTDIRRNLGI